MVVLTMMVFSNDYLYFFKFYLMITYQPYRTEKCEKPRNVIHFWWAFHIHASWYSYVLWKNNPRDGQVLSGNGVYPASLATLIRNHDDKPWDLACYFQTPSYQNWFHRVESQLL